MAKPGIASPDEETPNLSEVLLAADAAATATQSSSVQLQGEAAVEDALKETPVVFSKYSDELHDKHNDHAGYLIREVERIDAEIAQLNRERTDAMLAYSMISAAETARVR